MHQRTNLTCQLHHLWHCRQLVSRDCSSTAQSPSNNVCLLHQPPRIPEKVVIIAIAESHRGSRKFSAAGLCQPCRTPGFTSSIISPTRCSQGSGDCCGDRLILSLPRKDSQTHPKDSQTHPWPPQTSLSYPARKLLQSGTVKADREARAARITKACLAL